MRLSGFVPPRPPYLTSVSVQQRLAIGKKNLLAVWEERDFELEFWSAHVLRRQIFFLNCPEAVQFAFSLHSDNFERKSLQHRQALAPLLGDGLFISDGATWRHRRRIVAPIIHVSRLAAFAPVMVDAALETRDRLAGLAGQSIDILQETATLASEIICRTLFGRKLGHKHAGDVIGGFSDYQRQIGHLNIISFLGIPDWVPRWHGLGVRRAARRVHAVLDEIIGEFRAGSRGEDSSVIGKLMAARDSETGAPLSDNAIRNEVSVLILAGHETTANTLAWALYLLSQAPEAEARFHAEVDAVLGDRAPTLADVPALVYTRAVIEEAMRLYPPVPFLSREAVVTEHFRDRVIPKGSMVLVAPWLLHRHRKYWDRPDDFVPERFLPENAKTIAKFSYIPFGVGPRICAGMSFGLTEAILCLAVLGQTLRLRLKPNHDVRPVCRLTLRPDGGLPMIPELRKPGAVPTPDRTAKYPAVHP